MKTKSIFTLLILSILLSFCNQKKEVNTTEIKPDATLEQLTEIIKKEPKNAEAYYRRANYLLEKQKLGEATNDINMAIELDSTKAEYFITVADLHLIINNSGGCKVALDKSLSLDSNNIKALLKMSELYMYVKENVQSISYANRALNKDKTNANAYFLIGMNQKELQDTMRAMLAFQEALNYKQDFYNANIQLGLLHAARNNPLALNYYATAANINPKTPEPHYNKGVFYQMHNQTAKAMNCYSQALKLQATNKGALYNMGLLMMNEEKNYTKAASYFERNMLAQPNFEEGFYQHGVCMEKMNNKQQAAIDFEKALQINKDFAKASEGLKRVK